MVDLAEKLLLIIPHEAVFISKEINAPVQVVWTREDDMTAGPFRPGMVYQCKGGLTSRGKNFQSFKKMAGQNMDHQWPGADKDSYNGSTIEGFLETYFDSIPHYSFSDITTGFTYTGNVVEFGIFINKWFCL